MSTLKTPFKYDFVGSFLRPQALKDAKSKYKNNEISQEEYDKIVNDEITKLVAKQKELGYHAITDGEFKEHFGTLILCGDLAELNIRIPETEFLLTPNLQCLMIHIW